MEGLNMKEISLVKSDKVRSVAVAGVFSALTVLLAVIPFLGYIRISPLISFTILHVPVILAAVFGGPVSGMIVGLVFGITSLINATINPPTWLTPFLLDPRCSVLARIMIGLVAGLVFKVLCIPRVVPRAAAAAVTGFVGSLSNTVGLFTTMYVFHGQEALAVIMEKTGDTGKSYVGLLAALLGIGPVVEAVGAAVLCALVVGAVSVGSYARRRGSKLSKELPSD